MARWLLFAAMVPLTSLAQDVQRPQNGWRASDSEQADFLQTVNYPAVRTNTGGKRGAALISGRVRAAPKPARPTPPKGDDNESEPSREVATLNVNGAAMPLPLDPQGRYARPYAFGAGSNSLELKYQGSTAVRTQFYEANVGKVPTRLRIILQWDTDHTDVDLHVLTPDGQHAWYGNRVLANGAAIDVDVTDGFGPEIFSDKTPSRGTYQVWVNYYGGRSGKALTTARVLVVSHENSLQEKQQLFTVPLRRPGELFKLTSFVF